MHEYPQGSTKLPLYPSERWRDFDHLHRWYPINWPGCCRCRYRGNCGGPRSCHRIQSSDLRTREMERASKFAWKSSLWLEQVHLQLLPSGDTSNHSLISDRQLTLLETMMGSAVEQRHIRCRRRIRLGASMKKMPIREWRHKGPVSQYIGMNLILDTGKQLAGEYTGKAVHRIWKWSNLRKSRHSAAIQL